MVQPTGVGRPVCVLVKRVWSELKPKTGSRGKYKAEPATSGGGEGQAARACNPRGNFYSR